MKRLFEKKEIKGLLTHLVFLDYLSLVLTGLGCFLWLAFIPSDARGVILFGRPTNAAITWFEYKPEWKNLMNNPGPYVMQKAGYGYLYSNGNYLKSLPLSTGKRLESACVKVLAGL